MLINPVWSEHLDSNNVAFVFPSVHGRCGASVTLSYVNDRSENNVWLTPVQVLTDLQLCKVHKVSGILLLKPFDECKLRSFGLLGMQVTSTDCIVYAIVPCALYDRQVWERLLALISFQTRDLLAFGNTRLQK